MTGGRSASSAGRGDRRTWTGACRAFPAWLRSALICAVTLAVPASLRAEEFAPATISFHRPDWNAANAALRARLDHAPQLNEALTFTGISRISRSGRSNLERQFPAFVQLSAAVEPVLPSARLSPVPVLLPFDTPAWLTERQRGGATLDTRHFLNGFSRLIHFSAGPAGYTAIVQLAPDEPSDLPRRAYPRPVEIHITGSLITYDVDDPAGGQGEPVKALESEFPGIRRFIREGFVRYAFVRFGVPYVVSIDCLDSTPRRKRLSCREAYPVAEKYLRALSIAGGVPARPRLRMTPPTAERPKPLSSAFSFFAPGDIVAGTGFRGRGGHSDWTSYAQIRFPIENAPAVAGSQSYLHWGQCARRGRFPLPRVKGQADRCGEADRSASANGSPDTIAIPWRDNFCERRDLEVRQCPAGYGHQGTDIRAPSCLTRPESCRAGADRIVAVRDGQVLRTPGQEGAFVVVNEPYEHIRFRHMHMVPSRMDADGLVHGRRLGEGEVIGAVANYQDRSAGTSVHLHFDIQVFTRDGWIWVNPYTTLIAAYERLIDQRGRLYQPPRPEPRHEGPPEPEAPSAPTESSSPDSLLLPE